MAINLRNLELHQRFFTIPVSLRLPGKTKGGKMTRPKIRGVVLIIFLISLLGNPLVTMGEQIDDGQGDISHMPKKPKPQSEAPQTMGEQIDDGQGDIYQVPKKPEPKSKAPQTNDQQIDNGRGDNHEVEEDLKPQSKETPKSTVQTRQDDRKGTHKKTSPEKSPPLRSRKTVDGQSGQSAVQHPKPVITERVLSRKFGSEGLQQLLKQVESIKAAGRAGRGAPMAHTWFDNARPRISNDDNPGPSGTLFFQGSGFHSPNSNLVPVTDGTVKIAPVEDSEQTIDSYDGIPGGIVLEGFAVGLDNIDSVRYDKRFNALILDDRGVYFIKVPPKTLAVLCRAIAEDDKERVGVSLGEVERVYGEVPEDSDLAWDLKIADHFLGEIVFGENEWTSGYLFADNFTPKPSQEESYYIAVFFKLNGFEFRIQQEEILPTRANFEVQIWPLSQSVSSEGGHLPDYNAISQGRIPRQFEVNARHLANNISYYRRERLIDQIFCYGEVAALLRTLKRAGFDLKALATNIPGGP